MGQCIERGLLHWCAIVKHPYQPQSAPQRSPAGRPATHKSITPPGGRTSPSVVGDAWPVLHRVSDTGMQFDRPRGPSMWPRTHSCLLVTWRRFSALAHNKCVLFGLYPRSLPPLPQHVPQPKHPLSLTLTLICDPTSTGISAHGWGPQGAGSALAHACGHTHLLVADATKANSFPGLLMLKGIAGIHATPATASI